MKDGKLWASVGWTVGLGLPAIAALAPASAQESEDVGLSARQQLDPIVVTATRSAETVSSLPGSLLVIGREEIERQAVISNDITALLSRYVPGLAPTNQTLSGASETFRGRSVQVLIDGVPRNTPLRDVSRILATIDSNQIERIEVINGASAIYGNGATGGVINLITKDAPGIGSKAELTTAVRAFTADIESSLTPELSVGVSATEGQSDFLMLLSGAPRRDQFDGAGNLIPSDSVLGQGNLDNSRKLDSLVKLGAGLTETARLEGSFSYSRFSQEPDFLTNFDNDPVSVDEDTPYPGASIEDDIKSLSVGFNEDDFRLGQLGLELFYVESSRRFAFTDLSAVNPLVLFSGDLADPTSPFNQTELESDVFGTRATVNTELDQLWPELDLTWGVDLGHETAKQAFVDGTEAIAPMSQTSFAGFVQAELLIGERFVVRGGVRYERFDLDVDDFTRPDYAFDLTGNGQADAVLPEVDVIGDEFSYDATVFNLGGVFYLTDEIDVFAGYAQGFSLPDIGGFTRRAQNVDPFDTTPIDIANIAPEASIVDTYELGVRGDYDRVRGSVSTFISTSDEGTNFDPTTNQLSQEEEMIWGAEAVIGYDVSRDIKIGAVIAYTEGKRDTDNDGDLDAYLPNNRIPSPFTTTLHTDVRATPKLDLHLEAVYTSERDRDDGDNQVKIEDTLLFNASASTPLYGGTLSFGIENILDTNYENPTASSVRLQPVSGLGRVVTLGFKMTF